MPNQHAMMARAWGMGAWRVRAEGFSAPRGALGFGHLGFGTFWFCELGWLS